MNRIIITIAMLLSGLTASAQFNVENPAVREYIQGSKASFSAVEGNFGQQYFDTQRDFRADQPNDTTIVFKESAKKVEVYQDMKKVQSVTLKGQNEITLTNLVPGCKYRCMVTTKDNKTVAYRFTTCGQVRMIKLDRGFNIRDLGGWKGLNGKTVRYEWLYRGGSLGGSDMDGKTSDITDADRKELYRLGIRAQLDLRAATNGGKYSGESSLHSYSQGKTTLTDADFKNIMTDYGAYDEDASVVEDIAWIIAELRQGKPVYFNCRQGADRTGTIAFIIEGLLGCYDYQTASGGNQMALDYELTGFSGANEVDNWKVSTSYRGASEAYNNTHKLFRKILDLDKGSIQKSCYYYLNQRFADKGITIPSEDLDWFIGFMLK